MFPALLCVGLTTENCIDISIARSDVLCLHTFTAHFADEGRHMSQRSTFQDIKEDASLNIIVAIDRLVFRLR